MRALAQHARAHAEHHGFAAFLTDMAGRGRYGRRIALHLAMAARDLTYITRVLAGPDPELRRAALRAVRTLPVLDEAIPPALHEASTELRIAFYRSIIHARRTELADMLLPEVNERWGAKEAAALLPACSPSIVAEWLPSLAHAVTAWKTLTRRYPKLVLRCVDDEFTTTRRVALRQWRAVALREAARVEPALVLDLLERHDLGRWAEYLPGGVLGPMFRADLHRTARLLPRRGWSSFGSKAALLKRCNEFTNDELLTLVSTRSLEELLQALPIPRRAAIYTRLAHRDVDALHLLHLLPRELAVSEARRLRAWHSSVWHSTRAHLDDPKITLRITAFLPFEEAESDLRAAAFTGDPRRRDIARTLLLGAAQRSGDRARAAAVFGEVVDRIRNERDPARAALLEGIAGLRLDPRWAEHLDRLADAAIHARDTSERTREAIRKLADRALNTEPALATWALTSYVRLIDRFGAEALTCPEPVGRRYRRPTARVQSRPTLGRVLRRGQEHELLAMLTRRRDHELTVALARSLGSRLHGLPELLQDLRQTVLNGPDDVAAEAAELLLRRIRDKDTQVAALLADDPRTIRFAPVWHNVATRRTDLLPADSREVLAEHNIEPSMPGRWTDRQRDTIGATLAAIADDRDGPVEDRVRALRGLGRIPLPTKLIEHALGGEPVIAEAAIEACGGYPPALPQLLLRIPGPVALATAAKLCRVGAPSRLRDDLAKALLEGRVGARKLAARHLVSQRVPGAADLLLRVWADPELHPDVRIAVAVALQRLPEDERAHAALAEVPGRYASELMIRTLLQAIPEEYAPDHRAALADLVRGLMTAAQGPGVQFRAAKAFAIWVPWYRGGTDEIIEAAVTGDDTDMTVFLSLVRSSVLRAEALTVLRRLLAVEDHARVREVVKALNATDRDEEWKQDRARATAELLFEHPLHLLDAAGMVIHLLPLYPSPTDDLAPQAWVRELNFLADRLTPLSATRIISTHTMHFGWNRSIELMLPAVEALIACGGLTAGVLAVGLLNGSSPSSERQEAIERLRSSPHLDVRRLAWEIAQ
ncbi:hypothetical protein ACQPW1_34130 [Nocardia sp. CA-128927]|uniref:hypothetical protein n=1 Tax=Nocardia sp. CA-128927 TaxID=3239975 RepID=UPI003D9905EB